MDARKTPLACSGRRTFLARAAAATAAITGLGVLARPNPAKAATQTGPLLLHTTPMLALLATSSSSYGSPGTDPSIYRAGTNRLGVRGYLIVGPWAEDFDHSPTTGTYSAGIVLARDTDGNDNTIHFCNTKQAGTGAQAKQTTWVLEQAGNNHLVVKSVHNTLGDGTSQSGVFRTRLDFRYPGETTPDDHCHAAFVNSNLGLFDAENWTGAHFGGGKGVFALHNREAAPAANPVSGVFVYAEDGALKMRGGNGTITTLGPA